MDHGRVRVDDVKLFKEVEVAHVDHVAGHLSKTDVCHVTQRLQQGHSLASCLTVEQLFEEVVGTDRVEHLVVSEFHEEEVLIQIQTPIAKEMRK